MVTSPYEWKILEWDDKLQTNKTILICVLTWTVCGLSNSSLFAYFRRLHNDGLKPWRQEMDCSVSSIYMYQINITNTVMLSISVLWLIDNIGRYNAEIIRPLYFINFFQHFIPAVVSKDRRGVITFMQSKMRGSWGSFKLIHYQCFVCFCIFSHF